MSSATATEVAGSGHATLRRRSLPTPTGEPSARSLLLTVLGEHVVGLDEPVWSAALLAALDALGVQPKTARQAIARSSADGWLTRERVGRRARWALTPSTEGLLQDGAARIYSFTGVTEGWDGRWLLVRVSIPEERRDQRHVAHSRLAWAGFASLGQGLWVSPHPDRRTELLHALDLADPSGASPSMVFVTEPRGRQADLALVEQAWGDRAELRAAYRRFIDEIAAVADGHGEELTDRDAFVAQTRMVHEWRKFPYLDPALPEELLPDGWIGREAAEVFDACHRRWSGPAARWFAERNAAG